MRKGIYGLISAAILLAPLALAKPGASSRDVAAEQQSLQDARLRALRTLFREEADSQAVLEAAPGYAVLTAVGLDAGLASTRRIGGILRENRSGKDTYYRTAPLPGEVLDSSDFVAVFVFQTREAYRKFAEQGWDPVNGGYINIDGAALEEADRVGRPGVTVYQLTESGAADMARNIRIFKDDALN